jgi:hypothetical protein
MWNKTNIHVLDRVLIDLNIKTEYKLIWTLKQTLVVLMHE